MLPRTENSRRDPFFLGKAAVVTAPLNSHTIQWRNSPSVRRCSRHGSRIHQATNEPFRSGIGQPFSMSNPSILRERARSLNKLMVRQSCGVLLSEPSSSQKVSAPSLRWSSFHSALVVIRSPKTSRPKRSEIPPLDPIGPTRCIWSTP